MPQTLAKSLEPGEPADLQPGKEYETANSLPLVLPDGDAPGLAYVMEPTQLTEAHNKKVKDLKRINTDPQTYKIAYKDGSVYTGEVDAVRQKPCNFGSFVHANGEEYEGEFYNGMAQGKGSYTHSDGTVFKGHMSDDLKNGYGEEWYTNGDKYSGYFANGLKHGMGKYDWSSGAYYNGHMDGDRRQGLGVMKVEDVESYTGLWLNDKRHGKGRIKYANGDTYQGTFVNGKREGPGVLKNHSSIYKGNFENDVQHGDGVEVDRKSKKKVAVRYNYGARV